MFGANFGHFGPKLVRSLDLLSDCTIKGAKRHMKILLVIFWEKISFGTIWSFWVIFYCLFGCGQNWARPCYYWIFKLDKISFMITAGSLNSQDMQNIVKQSGHDFSSKPSCDGYCMDTIWCLCLEANIQQRVVWFCQKALRIYYLILFECKGPWMLKTDSLIF